MMFGPDNLQDITGVKASVFIAGLIGSLVSAMIDKGPLFERAISVAVGLACAIYGTEIVVGVVQGFIVVKQQALENAAAFLCGVTGMTLVRGAIDWIKARSKEKLLDWFITPKSK